MQMQAKMRPPLPLPVLLLAAVSGAATLFLLLLASPNSSFSLLLFSSPYARAPKLIFVLAGQSNMAGRGAVRSPLLPPYRPHPRVLRLAASRSWVPASPPLHSDIDTLKTCGLGPAMPLAHALLDESDEDLVLGLVPCAVGGSRIRMWVRGAPLYQAAVARARAAVAGGGGRVGAVLWFQGESDTVELDDALAYGERMQRMVTDLRADLGLPQLLVIQVGLASGEGNYTDIVREAQKKIDLPNVILVDAMGLPLQDDQLHLSTEAQLQLGNMLAEAYLKFNSSRDSRL